MTATREPQYPRTIIAYGTLRPGGTNHEHTLGHIPHHADLNVWLEGWGLYVTHGAFPYAVPDPGAHLIGTLLEFNTSNWADGLAACDWLEGYPHHYTRSVVTAHYPGPGGAQVKAWIYHPAGGLEELQRHGRPVRRIPSGDWLAADSPRRTPVSNATEVAQQTGAGS